MPDLLFELGCEELPASFVRRSAQQLEQEIVARLDAAGIPHGVSVRYGTPRRLIVSVKDVAERQPDRTEERRGPGLTAAFDANGIPTKALEGFCRGAGVSVDEVTPRDGYVWVTKRIPGQPVADLLTGLLPDAVRALQFDKAMRWGRSRMRFARPIRWMLAAFGGVVVPFEIESVKSGLCSRGHRFNHPDPFEATTLDALLEGLRSRQVEPDADVRERLIREGSVAVAGGTPDLTDALVDENVYLTEWPMPTQGEFAEGYLELPEPVLVTAMAKHERFFPVRGADGRLTNQFVSIRNGGEESVVRQGNAWVLGARFNDAKFFFEEDKRKSLDEFLYKTSGIVFHEKLGTVRERANRLSELARAVASETGADAQETEWARLAGLYAKADLSTGLVSELASLQGVIGGEYARREGMPEAVCFAIAHQYDVSEGIDPATPGGRTALRLIIADQLDKLAGYLGVGLAPSGTSDPFGLRRAATLLIHAAWTWDAVRSYKGLFDFANMNAPCRRAESVTELAQLFAARYGALLSDVPHDVLAAAVRSDSVKETLAPRRVRHRIETLSVLQARPAFIQTATRPLNIVRAAAKKGVDIPATAWVADGGVDRHLQSTEGVALAEACRRVSPRVAELARLSREPETVAQHLLELESPINAFFESTMVMVDDEGVRDARLSLLQAVSDALMAAGDFSLLISE
ncbi:MAG: glycine--tRNA ligase subunit beta [Nitrospirae bacterium]|nr:glycine--tRNA ligase subunit beta [Fimbriimonadaceae bacterium]